MCSCFRDRVDAGQRLAHELRHYAFRADVIESALQRGGVRIGFEIAAAPSARDVDQASRVTRDA